MSGGPNSKLATKILDGAAELDYSKLSRGVYRVTNLK